MFVSSAVGDPTPERGGRAKRYFTLRPLALQALRTTREALCFLVRSGTADALTGDLIETSHERRSGAWFCKHVLIVTATWFSTAA